MFNNGVVSFYPLRDHLIGSVYRFIKNTNYFPCLFSLTRIVRKAQAGVESLKCFSNQEWTFKNDNVLKLLSHMSPWDKKDFNMEYCEPSLEKLSEQRWLGCRRFVLKQEDSTIGRAKLNCLMWVSPWGNLWKQVSILFIFLSSTEQSCCIEFFLATFTTG